MENRHLLLYSIVYTVHVDWALRRQTPSGTQGTQGTQGDSGTSSVDYLLTSKESLSVGNCALPRSYNLGRAAQMARPFGAYQIWHARLGQYE
jgi:hypothetical protein